MILLQNPSIPVATNAIEIDAAILDIKLKLESNLVWLTNGYGRAYKNIDATQGTTVFYPEIYLGEQNNSQRYTNISPDNDKQGQCFFFVTKENISEFQTGMYSFLSYDTAIIFSVNMELINSTLLETEIFQQNLVSEVRDILTRLLVTTSYQLKINSVDFLFDNVFSEFDLKDAEQLQKAPLSHFRFNCNILMPEPCPATAFDRCAALTQNLSVSDKACVCSDELNINKYSMLFDGVNEYVRTKASASYDLDRLDSFSFSVWIKPDILKEGDLINKFGSPLGYFVRLSIAGEIRVGLFHDNASNKIDVRTAALVSTGVWQNVAFTYDGTSLASGVKLYYNGSLQSNIVAFDGLSLSMNNPAEFLKFGANITNARYFDGYMDEVRMWNIELNSTEILNNYNSGTPVPQPLREDNLIVNCRMGEGSIFGINNRHFPDSTTLTTGYYTQNMEQGDLTTDIP